MDCTSIFTLCVRLSIIHISIYLSIYLYLSAIFLSFFLSFYSLFFQFPLHPSALRQPPPLFFLISLTLFFSSPPAPHPYFFFVCFLSCYNLFLFPLSVSKSTIYSRWLWAIIAGNYRCCHMHSCSSHSDRGHRLLLSCHPSQVKCYILLFIIF